MMTPEVTAQNANGEWNFSFILGHFLHLGFLHLEFNKGQILSDIVFPFFEVSS
jgi:hypothetical protein